MPTIWFIRHAESEANAGLPTSHPESISLTPRGLEQAEHLIESFPRQPDLIITSPFLRARQTAQPITAYYPNVRQEVWPVQEFTFLAPPRWADTTWRERRPVVRAFWERLDPNYIDGEGAESFANFMQRVRDTLTSLSQRKEQFIAVISHEQFIHAIICLLLNGGDSQPDPWCMSQFHQFQQTFTTPNAAIWEVDLNPGAGVHVRPLHQQLLRSLH